VALRAIWWRKGASAAVLLIAVFSTSMAAAGPVYLAAAEESILQYALRAAPTTASGAGVDVTAGVSGPASPDNLVATVNGALRGDPLRRSYPEAIGALFYPTRVLDDHGLATIQATVAYRAGAANGPI
jgi:hypothetical protein